VRSPHSETTLWLDELWDQTRAHSQSAVAVAATSDASWLNTGTDAASTSSTQQDAATTARTPRVVLEIPFAIYDNEGLLSLSDDEDIVQKSRSTSKGKTSTKTGGTIDTRDADAGTDAGDAGTDVGSRDSGVIVYLRIMEGDSVELTVGLFCRTYVLENVGQCSNTVLPVIRQYVIAAGDAVLIRLSDGKLYRNPLVGRLPTGIDTNTDTDTETGAGAGAGAGANVLPPNTVISSSIGLDEYSIPTLFLPLGVISRNARECACG
jgi:hypothetical protein